MSTYKALYLSPMIPSYNLEATGKFFKDILSFTPHMETETYAIYHKDNLTVHLLQEKISGKWNFTWRWMTWIACGTQSRTNYKA